MGHKWFYYGYSCEEILLYFLGTLMFGFTGVGFLGAVDVVGGVETRAEQFLLTLAAASSAGLH